MGRAPCCEKVGLRKGRWSAQEDEILTKYIQANGEGSWRSLPKNAGLLRCGKSCRLRWINYLRSDLKRGNISAQEEDLIIQLHSSLGNRWSQIASHLPGRTDNEIKNYWNSHLSRKIYAFRRPASTDQTMDTVTANPNNDNTATKRKGGRTSRWAMKKDRKSNAQPVATAEKTNDQNSVAAAVLVPATPSLENEGLSITTSDDIDFEDFMVLEGDKNTEGDKVERSEEEAGKAGNNSGDSGEGSLTSGGDRETITDMTRIQEGHLQGIDDGGGEFCLNDMVDTWLLEDDGGGVSILTEEREINDDVSRFGSKKASGDQPGCANTNAQDLYSSSPMPSLFEYEFWHNWDIGVDDRLVNHNESRMWDDVDKQNLLSWLWEDDDCQVTQQIDPQKQNPKLMPSILS